MIIHNLRHKHADNILHNFQRDARQLTDVSKNNNYLITNFLNFA